MFLYVFISFMWAGLMASGVGRVSGMCVAGRLFEVALSAGVFTEVA